MTAGDYDRIARDQVRRGREIGEALYLRSPKTVFTEQTMRDLERDAAPQFQATLVGLGLEGDHLEALVRFYSRLLSGTARRRLVELQDIGRRTGRREDSPSPLALTGRVYQFRRPD